MSTLRTLPDEVTCPVPGGPAPGLADAESAPLAGAFLPKVLDAAPRGAAWGTDESITAGVSPMRQMWLAFAHYFENMFARAFDTASQAFPSAVTFSLDDWEAELGLPDTCNPAPQSAEQRVGAVRAKFGSQGGSSPGFFICLAAAIGYTIWIEEPSYFEAGGELNGIDALGPGDGVLFEIGPGAAGDALTELDADGEQFWIVHVMGLAGAAFEVGYSEAGDPLTGIPDISALKCIFDLRANIDTVVIYDLTGVA